MVPNETHEAKITCWGKIRGGSCDGREAYDEK